MLTRLWLVWCCVVAVVPLWGSALEDSIAKRLALQQYLYPQEKIHVTTDKGAYMTGDTIWLRAFVVNAATNEPVKASKYVYVELRNPHDSVACRVKLMERKGAYTGYVPLDEKLPEGGYTLVAYTLFMQSQGEEYYFKKPVAVTSVFGTQSEMTGTFTWENEAGEWKLRVSLDYTDRSTGSAKDYTRMDYVLDDQKMRYKSGGSGTVRFTLSGADARSRSMLVGFNNYRKFFALPAAPGELSVRFFPEGGYLVAGEACRVSVKATDGRGLSLRGVTGVVTDASGREVARFTTGHGGMAVFSLTAQAGAAYSCRCTSPGTTITQDFALPEAPAGAVSLSVTRGEGGDITVSPVGPVPAGCIIMLQERANLVAAVPASQPLTFPESALEAGVVQALLLTPEFRPLAERLFFAGDNSGRATVVSTDRSSYPARARVDVDVRLAGYGLPAGSYAVSVTDDASVRTDSVAGILTQLLLQSDVRGYIEDPAHYFTAGHEADLDALMLTQGWRRYDIPRTLRGSLSEPSTPIEKGYAISGRVLSDWRKKPVKGATVQVMAPRLGYVDAFPTDADGRFTIKGYDFPDSTKLVLQALDKHGGKLINVSVNVDTVPVLSSLPIAAERQEDVADDNNYIAQETKRITTKNGMSMILLDEVVVTAMTHKTPEDFYEAFASRSLRSEEIEEKGIGSLETALRQIAGLRVQDGQVYSGRDMVAFFVDGVHFSSIAGDYESAPVVIARNRHELVSDSSEPIPETTYSSGGGNIIKEIEEAHPLETIKRIDYLRPGDAVVLGRSYAASGGAVVITTKDGSEYKPKKDPTMHLFRPFGYQRPAEFYSPDYAHGDAGIGMGLDRRNTLCWLPCVEVGESGTSHFSFFTNDVQGTTYTISLEGVTNSGQLIHSQKTIKAE